MCVRVEPEGAADQTFAKMRAVFDILNLLYPTEENMDKKIRRTLELKIVLVERDDNKDHDKSDNNKSDGME